MADSEAKRLGQANRHLFLNQPSE